MATSDAQAGLALGIFSGARVNASAHVVWDSGRGEPVVAQVAVAGDFLPAGALSLPPGGWREAARRLAAHLEDIDVAFLNLECALDAEGLSPRPLAGLGQIVSGPSAALDFLTAIRSSVISLANNHTYDFGPAGVARTQCALARRGIISLGAGRTLQYPPDTFLWQWPGNIRVGIWAAARASRDLATRNREGVEPVTLSRASQAREVLESAGANFSIALLHAGCLRTNRPDPGDEKLMDEIAKNGFGLVAASHSHRIGGAKSFAVQTDAPSFCFYGLGSIASGYVSSPIEREGLIVVARFHPNGGLARVEVRPLLLGESGFGEVPSPEMSRTILGRFESLSEELADGSAERLFYDDLSHGLARLYIRDASAAFRSSGLRGLIRKAGRIRMRHIRRAVYGLMG